MDSRPPPGARCRLCGAPFGPPDPAETRCPACREEERRRIRADAPRRERELARRRELWAARREEENAKQRARYAAKRAANNAARVAAGGPPTLPGDMVQTRWIRAVKAAALLAYGGPEPRCHCCGEGLRAFLGIAGPGHAGVGEALRRREGDPAGPPDRHCHFYRRLADAGYPPGYVIRCVNCKHALVHYGACPHQDPAAGTAAAAANVPTWRRRQQRDAVLAAYGGRCACCGEARPAFLRLAGPPFGGGKHGPPRDGKLLAAGCPPGWVVRCHACDTAVRARGLCAHVQPAEGDPFAVVWPGDPDAASPALGAPGGRTRRALARLAAMLEAADREAA